VRFAINAYAFSITALVDHSIMHFRCFPPSRNNAGSMPELAVTLRGSRLRSQRYINFHQNAALQKGKGQPGNLRTGRYSLSPPFQLPHHYLSLSLWPGWALPCRRGCTISERAHDDGIQKCWSLISRRRKQRRTVLARASSIHTAVCRA
jgi:hypothetical protein